MTCKGEKADEKLVREFGRVSININGDFERFERDEIIERARLAEKAGVRVVWVGEFEGFEDPLKVADAIASSTNLKIGFGILSPLRRGCSDIEGRLEDLVSKYGQRFFLGIAPGKFINAGVAVKKTLECIVQLRRIGIPVLAGVSSPRITQKSSQIADGLLINYVKPEFLRWLKMFVVRNVFTASYGPSLILPSEFEEDLLIAASIVFLSSRKFVEEFGFQRIAREVENVDIQSLIELRMSGKSIKETDISRSLFRHKNFLLKNFTISGGLKSVVYRIKDLLEIVDHVILSDPFFRDHNSLKQLAQILGECEEF